MDTFHIIILGIVQGITEFLPISSSGHLVLVQHFLGFVEENLLVDTMLHLGTALAICVVFYRDIIGLGRDMISSDAPRRATAIRYGGYIVLGTIPAAVAGVFFKDFFEALFGRPRAAGAMLLVTAVLLFVSARPFRGTGKLDWRRVLLIGFAQALAIVPGISRSGSTIAVALLIGVSRDEAGRFSFLLALPAIFGAVVLQLPDIAGLSVSIPVLLLGFAVSMVSGYFSLRLLLRFVQQGRLFYFGFYCIGAGLLTIFLLR